MNGVDNTIYGFCNCNDIQSVLNICLRDLKIK